MESTRKAFYLLQLPSLKAKPQERTVPASFGVVYIDLAVRN